MEFVIIFINYLIHALKPRGKLVSSQTDMHDFELCKETGQHEVPQADTVGECLPQVQKEKNQATY